MTSISERPVDVAAAGLHDLVKPDEGVVSRTVFIDEAIYRTELDRIFTKTWLFIGHESPAARTRGLSDQLHGRGPGDRDPRRHGGIRVMSTPVPRPGNGGLHDRRGHVKFFRCPCTGGPTATTVI